MNIYSMNNEYLFNEYFAMQTLCVTGYLLI